jgi:formylmethanofuran dehydrogenase subunit E
MPTSLINDTKKEKENSNSMNTLGGDPVKWLKEAPLDEIFNIKKPDYPLPEEARLFPSIDCEICGESAAEPYIRIENGKKVCLDCFHDYFRV